MTDATSREMAATTVKGAAGAGGAVVAQSKLALLAVFPAWAADLSSWLGLVVVVLTCISLVVQINKDARGKKGD